MDDDEVEDEGPPAPTPQRVAARALVMSAVVCRGFIEKDAGKIGAEELRLRVADWLKTVDVISEIEPHEASMLDAPLGTLASGQAIEGGWLCEGLAVLAWALGRFPLPAYDQEVDPHAVAESLDFLWDDANALISTASLRQRAEITSLADQLLDLHWRLADFKKRPIHRDFKSFVEKDILGPLLMGIRFAGDDLAIGDLPIIQASEENADLLNSLARERHRAINWLLGQEAIYSQVTPDT